MIKNSNARRGWPSARKEISVFQFFPHLTEYTFSKKFKYHKKTLKCFTDISAILNASLIYLPFVYIFAMIEL